MPNKDLGYYAALPYRIELVFHPADQLWFVRFPELPGCKAHGETPEEALAAGEDVKGLWLETAIEQGKDIPEPGPDPEYSGKLVLRLPKRLHQAAAEAASHESVSLNAYLVELISEGVQRSGLKNMIRYVHGVLDHALSRIAPGASAVLLSVGVEGVYDRVTKDISEVETIAPTRAPAVENDAH